MITKTIPQSLVFRLLMAMLLFPGTLFAQVDTSSTFNGTATYYTVSGTGACDIPSGEFSNYYVSIDISRYGNSAWCGAWLEVTGPSGTTQVQVIDSGSLGGSNNLDMSPDAFQAIGGSTISGPLAVTWKWISAPGSIGPVKFYDGGSSNLYYLSIKPVNLVNPVVKVEADVGRGWIELQRQSGYFFNSSFGSPIAQPFSLRITDVFGNEVTSSGFTLASLPGGQSGSGNFPPVTNGIVIEEPVTVDVGDGGTRDLGYSADGSESSLTFTIRNQGSAPLTINSVSLSGTNAVDFSVKSVPSAPVPVGATDTFEIAFASTVVGSKSALVTVASNDPNLPNYEINLTGTAVSSSNDGDSDGLNDAAEVLMADLGFDWTIPQTSLVNTYFAAANKAGLFSPAQIQNMNINSHMLQRDTATGRFKLKLSLGKTTNMVNFTPFSFSLPGISVNGSGELEYEFSLADDTAFLRIGAE